MKIQYVECGCCGHFHLPEFFGDCRDNANRFNHMQLDEKHGSKGWDYLSEEDQLQAEESDQ
ncbi:hypothetical protein [Mesorhizobium sp.]|uniref:hypothetical protein n=1 Tax=Mesorhizobium sp. TaxID=1871066 RepID=UPI000FE56802|nr:hypothetical protein [Mesorhizobium sp.]RWE37431.1 MAG: hypothetical protein EOS77_02305 [Mesorhizobium sp.]